MSSSIHPCGQSDLYPTNACGARGGSQVRCHRLKSHAGDLNSETWMVGWLLIGVNISVMMHIGMRSRRKDGEESDENGRHEVES